MARLETTLRRRKAELRKRAWRLAGSWLLRDVDAFELPDDLSEADEDYIREYIGEHVAEFCLRKGEVR